MVAIICGRPALMVAGRRRFVHLCPTVATRELMREEPFRAFRRHLGASTLSGTSWRPAPRPVLLSPLLCYSVRPTVP